MNESTTERLNAYYATVNGIILSRQNPATGLIPASVAVTSHGDYRDAWVRDNVYSIMAVWGLALAYRRLDDNLGRAYELEHATVKNMRGLLFSMIQQADKVELFKNTQRLDHALHAKYNTATGATVVADNAWGHLQIDATSIYLLMLAQMTASGLQIIFTLDEVHFIQNLVFYVERAYRTPDYGIWERGNKLNHGLPELNSSSIGQALAALQAINNVNLFGARGGPSSVIHVLPDEIIRNATTLHSALPRESNSKEVDASLLAVIGYPAFAVSDRAIVDKTRNEIIKKLGGVYGCKRFLRDGHQTVLENTSRLHYDPLELNVFKGIECEWPLFFTYLILDGLFREDQAQVEEYRAKLDAVLVQGDHLKLGRKSTMKLVPELYIVPIDLIESEREDPGSQERVANENVPLVWAQSLYILGQLIQENLLSPAELDPLGKRLICHTQPSDVVVQILLLSESVELQAKLATFGLDTQTVASCSPVTISPPSALRDAYTRLGENKKMRLTGRPTRPIGTLSTCKLYRCQGKLYAFLPHFMDREEFYLVSDNDYLVTVFEQELSFVRNHWQGTGRPTMVVMLTQEMLGRSVNLKSNDATSLLGLANDKLAQDSRFPPHGFNNKKNLLNLMMSLRSGACGGVRVRLGRLASMINTANIQSLDFLVGSDEHSGRAYLHDILKGGDSPVESLVTRMPVSNDLLHGDVSEGAPPTPRKRSMQLVSQVDLDLGHQYIGEDKSPLTSIFYTEEPESHHEFSPQSIRSRMFVDTAFKESEIRINKERNSSLKVDTFASGIQSCLSNDLPLSCEEVFTATSSKKSYLSLNLKDPSNITRAIEILQLTGNLYDQVDLLHYLSSCKPMDFHITHLSTLHNCLEEVYVKAMYTNQWTIVRQAAGLLKKVVNSLTINVTDLLIRQKPITVGFGSKETFITSPMSPTQLADLIHASCGCDVREAPLVLEVLTYLGSFVRSNPAMFNGIIRVRIHFFVIAMREEVSRMRGCNEEEAVEFLMQLSPFEMKSLLGQVLTVHEQININADYISAGTSSIQRLKMMRKESISDFTSTNVTTSSYPLPDKLELTAQSAGFSAGSFAKIEFARDGFQQLVNVVYGRGLNVSILDPYDGTVLQTASFDTHISKDESEEFAKLIEWLEPGTLAIVVAQDDCYENLTEAARVAIESLGSASIRSVKYRDSWCIIGEKGALSGTVPEDHKHPLEGPTATIRRAIDLKARREKVIFNLDNKSLSLNASWSLKDMLPSNGRWLRRRKNDGALNRVPPDFYPKVWKVLSLCNAVIIGRHVMEREPTIMEKTPEEFNFALQVECLLDVIRDPAERQIVVECLVVISSINERNPLIKITSGTIDILKIVRDAVCKYWACWTAKSNTQRDSSDATKDISFEKNEKLARRMFFDLPQSEGEGTMFYLAQSCVSLVFDITWGGV